MKQHTLWTLRESRTLTADVFHQFKEKAATHGYGPTGALLRLMHRYLARGFDDGRPEQAEPKEGQTAE
jgi:hypothetical protein